MSLNFPRKAGGEAVQGIELSAEVLTFVKLHQGKENHLWDCGLGKGFLRFIQNVTANQIVEDLARLQSTVIFNPGRG